MCRKLARMRGLSTHEDAGKTFFAETLQKTGRLAGDRIHTLDNAGLLRAGVSALNPIVDGPTLCVGPSTYEGVRGN